MDTRLNTVLGLTLIMQWFYEILFETPETSSENIYDLRFAGASPHEMLSAGSSDDAWTTTTTYLFLEYEWMYNSWRSCCVIVAIVLLILFMQREGGKITAWKIFNPSAASLQDFTITKYAEYQFFFLPFSFIWIYTK